MRWPRSLAQFSIGKGAMSLPCLLCDEPQNNHHHICDTCWHDSLQFSLCHSPIELTQHPHALATMELKAIDGLCVPFIYQWPLSHLITAYKYQDKTAVRGALSAFAQQGLQQWQLAGGVGGNGEELSIDFNKAPDVWTLVPNHAWRWLKRGFNHLDYLQTMALNISNIKDVSGGITRTKHTHSQAKLTAHKRRKNLASAFQVNVDLTGQHILLLDDVVTTGATLSSLAQTCKQAGAVKVSAFCLAWARLD
ncbi:ComF family protein [Saccharobesus litoralis]|nr:hypothetical protein [Saccharobesus litoralis]